jgi:HTH-type transcriptional regulator/antitoxin HigA
MEEGRMTEIVPAQAFSPGEFLRDELEERGWTQAEFAKIIGRPPRLVNELIAGKRGITPETAHELAAAFGTSAQLWMNLDAAYQLSLVAPKTERIAREAALRERFPVREMQKRGWIQITESFEETEQSVLGYFGLRSASDVIQLPHAARRNHDEELTEIQWAWIFRINQLATALHVPAYSEERFRAATLELERLMTEPEEVRHIPKILAECGVRLVIVEPIPGSKIDGVCFWLKADTAPVIGLSLKWDHIDRFWFTLWHEIEHVLRSDGKGGIIVDEFDDNSSQTGEAERAANEGAANRCVPAKAMNDFIARHSPMFAEKNMIGFAKIMKRHPGIVAGQIQRRTNRWDLFRKHQPRVRKIIIQTALTDGYGCSGPSNL